LYRAKVDHRFKFRRYLTVSNTQACALLVLVASFFTWPAFGQEALINVTDVLNPTEIKDQVEILRDDTGELTLEDVRTSTFKYGVDSIDRQPGPNTAYWVRFRLFNDTSISRSVVLTYPYARVGYMDTYVIDDANVIELPQRGFYSAYDPQNATNWIPLSGIQIDPGETADVYMRLAAFAYFHLSLVASSPAQASDIIQRGYLVYGLIFGAMTAAMAYVASMWRFTPGIYGPALIGYIGFTLAYAVIGSGLTRDFIGFTSMDFTKIQISMSVTGIIFCAILFARPFLGTREFMPRIDIMLQVVMYLAAAIFLLAPLLPDIMHVLTSIMSPVSLIALAVTCVTAVVKKLRGAVIYFAASIVSMAGGVAGNLLDFGLIPANELTANLMFPGMALSALTLAFAYAERARTHQAESDARFQAMFDSSIDAIISLDGSGKFLDINRAAEDMFGYDRESVVGRHFAEAIVHPGAVERYKDTWKILTDPDTEDQILGKRIEVKGWRQQGSSFPLEMSVVKTEANGDFFYTGHVRDLTEVKEIEAELEQKRDALLQSEKLSALGSLLAGVAHELNNPLSIVIGRASMLKDLSPDEKTKSAAGKIHDAAQRCARIVRSFLAMARQRPIEKESGNLNEVVNGAIDLISYNLNKSNIQIERLLDEDLPDCEMDADQLTQVVINLLVNSQHALDKVDHERRIQLSTGLSEDAQTVVMDVVDNGPGIPSDIVKRIFDPFFTTKPVGGGTGLGLSVSRGMIESHGGTIEIVETSEQGTRIRVSLPMEPTANTERTDQEELVPQS